MWYVDMATLVNEPIYTSRVTVPLLFCHWIASFMDTLQVGLGSIFDRLWNTDEQIHSIPVNAAGRYNMILYNMDEELFIRVQKAT